MDLGEAQRYARRVGDRWPLERALLGRDRDGEYVLVLVSQGFHGVPWLERLRVAEALWDRAAMGAPVRPRCYTPVEYERQRAELPAYDVDLLS